MKIPAFINPEAGSASEAREALEATTDVEVHDADDLEAQVAEVVRQGARRVIVAGGDGSVAAAAGVLAGTDISLAVVPGGTLNHLAKDLRIPLELPEAARLASTGTPTPVDVGRANDRIFLNTSSVGAYVVFVRVRERLEPRLGYWLASLVASVRLLFRLRLFTVVIDVDGVSRRYRTPLVFVGVGEREAKLPHLGGRIDGGKRGLHVIVVQRRTGARLFSLALAAAARGLESVSRGPAVDAFVVDRCTIELPERTSRIALDGEIVTAEGPLEYSIWRDALHVVVPPATSLDNDSRAG